MTNFNIIHELEKLHQFLYGAYRASSDSEFTDVTHHACHLIDELISQCKQDEAESRAKMASSLVSAYTAPYQPPKED